MIITTFPRWKEGGPNVNKFLAFKYFFIQIIDEISFSRLFFADKQ